MHYDLPLDEARVYRPDLPAPDDLEEFWVGTLARIGRTPPTWERVDSGLVTVETYDVTLAGFDDHPVRAWLHLPAEPLRPGAQRPGVLPGVVQFQGYNGGRGLPHEHVFWASAGYAQLVVDTRGQGSGWTAGATGDPGGSGPAQPGFLTRGIDAPDTYYYRRVYADAVAALEVLRGHELVDPSRVAVAGGSQGGGISTSVAALAPSSVAAVLSDVPFLCDFRRAAAVAQTDPYLELVRYLAAHRGRIEETFTTLSYFDVAVLGRLATAPSSWSVALMDVTCPPSTVFAAYNSYGGPKEIEVYEYNDHEGGDAFQRTRQLAWLAETL